MSFYKVLVINGPNLNLLGTREPEIYGSDTLESLQKMLDKKAKELGIELIHFQSNHEGDIVDIIQKTRDEVSFCLINAGAYTHTSVAIRDALCGVNLPFYEIHISNVHKREDFRHHSYLSDKALGVIVGFGVRGYVYALENAYYYLTNK